MRPPARMRRRAAALAATAGMLWTVQAPDSLAAELIHGSHGHAALGVEAAAFTALTAGTNFGLGRIDFFSGENTGDAQWAEGYVKPELDFEWTPGGGAVTVYGGVAGVAAATVGEGDASGFTTETGDIDFEAGFAGLRWRGLDLSAGAQPYQIGDGLVLMDGHFDQRGDGAFYLTPRIAFSETAIARYTRGPLRLEAFWLKADDDSQDASELTGGNVELDGGRWGHWGASWFRIGDSLDHEFLREGMQVANLRAYDVTVPGLEGFAVRGEYMRQFGDTAGRARRLGFGRYDADAWYVEASLALPFARGLRPELAWRYAVFSGDADADGRIETWDPLFYGFNYDRGFGSWYQGEVTSYMLFNSNQRNHMVKLTVAPRETWHVQLFYWRFDLDERSYFGTPVRDRHFADEVDVVFEWYGSRRWYFAGALAGALPGDAARQAFGDDRPYLLAELIAVARF